MKKRIRGKVRIALIGAGGISRAHARGFLEHRSRVECVALCDVSGENLAARDAQLGGGIPQFRDWRAMFRKMGDGIDAVDICLPHHLHAAAILDAAAAGAHILCEKPMCLDLREADRIARAVRRARITYMSAHNQLFMPAVREAKKLLGAGAIGKVRWLRSQDCFAAPIQAFRGKWRSKAKLQGGGELIDTGYHPVYRLLHLAGAKVVGVRGSMGRFLQRIEGEDTACVQVRFANGALGEILTSWAFPNPSGSHQVHVIGEKGEIFGSGNTLGILRTGKKAPTVKTFKAVDTFSAEIAHFADCLRRGARPLHSVEEGRTVLEVILAAARDARGWQRFAEA